MFLPYKTTVFQEFLTDEFLDRASNEEFLKRIDGWFNKSYQTVKDHAKLTDRGVNLFNTFKECAYE